MSSLNDLMTHLEAMQDFIDQAPEITKEMIESHLSAVGAVNDKVDRLIGFIERMQIESAAAYAKAEMYKRRGDVLENSMQNAKEYAKAMVLLNPDLEYRGTKGKLTVQRVADKLVYNIEKQRYSSTNVIAEHDILSGAVDPKYVTPKTVMVIDNDKVKKDIEAGVAVPFAKLEENKSLRIRI